MSARRQVVAASVLVFSMAAAAANASTLIADWTFESSAPLTAGPFSPEVGSGSALGSHAAASTYSSPAGNGSSHSFSSTSWAVGDYYLFNISTLGLGDLSLSWDQTSSNTGPRDFALQYSTDGSSFITFASYQVLANSSPNTPWSSATHNSAYTINQDLSAISALDNKPSIFLRLIDQDTVSANGGTVASGGTDRIDNFAISASPVPIPAAIWLFASGLLGVTGLRGRRPNVL